MAETTSFPFFTDSPLQRSLSLPDWYKGIIVAAVPSVIGITGNAIVLASYLKFPELQSPTNMLIANQGLADLLTCVFYGLYTYLNYTISGRHLTSEYKYLCLFALCSLLLSAWSSLFNLLLLNLDRLVNIQFPFVYARIVDETFVKRSIIILWLVMVALLSIPLFGVNTWQAGHICGASTVLPSAYMTNFFLVSSFLVLFLVAAISLFICGIVIRKRKVVPSGNEDEQRQQQSQYKLTKMLLTVVGIFYVCWLPYTLTNVVLILCSTSCFSGGIPQWFLIVVELSKALVMYNSAINPLIYVWKSKAFKRAFQRITHLTGFLETDSTD